jgi:hypothetical protein
MQNPNMAAQMAAMNANGGPVDGTPIMGNMPNPRRMNTDPREQLNTYIYDYLLRNGHYRAAQTMLDSSLKLQTGPAQKYSPKDTPNGVDAQPEPACEMPAPRLPSNQMADNSFLLDWWVQFWDIYEATKSRGTGPTKGNQYIAYTKVKLSYSRILRGTDKYCRTLHKCRTTNGTSA